MREVSLGDGLPLKLTPTQRTALKTFLQNGHTKALAARAGWEGECRQAIRGYEGNPSDEKRWTPFENAPVIEITVGASDCDAIISQAEDLVYSMEPPLVVRDRHPEWADAADALQEYVNVECSSGTWNFEPGTKEGIIDWAQLGTMVWYIPYTKTVRKTDVRKVVTFGPKIYSLDPDDFILPANATKNVQTTQFATMRMRMTRAELKLAARINNWNVDDAGTPDNASPIRVDRMMAAGLDSTDTDKHPKAMIALTFCYFDVDGDGEEEDIQVIWNMVSGNILKVMYNEYDCRPFVLECYQDRAHTWAGLGVMKMDMPFQRSISEIWNNHVWNMMMANAKVYTGPSTAMQEMTEVYPGKFMPNDDGEVKALDMGQVNSSAVVAEGELRNMSRERTGLQALNAPMQSSNRTPVGTTSQVLGQANRRFTHPFNNLRNGFAQVVMQCLYRVQERIRMGDKQLLKRLRLLMGDEQGQRIIDLMKHSDVELTEALDVQLKATSATDNRETDFQNMVTLSTQIFPQYWAAMKELAVLKAQPPFPGADVVATQAEAILNDFWHELLKTYDTGIDTAKFQIHLDAIKPVMQQLGMEQVPGQLSAGLQQLAPQQPPGALPYGQVPVQ